MPLYKVQRTYFVEANSDWEAIQESATWPAPNRLTVEKATEQEIQELTAAEAAAQQDSRELEEEE